MPKSLVLFSWLLTLMACASTLRPEASACPKSLRAVIDGGSGATKLTLAEVSVCADRVEIVRLLDDRTHLPVPLQASKNGGTVISAAAIEAFVTTIGQLKAQAFETARKLAPRYRTIEFTVVGTHAIRTASNQAQVTAALARANLPLRILSQAEEAALGYAGVRAQSHTCPEKDLIVWDIGGGSMQLTDATGQTVGLSLGSEGFKEQVIEGFHLPGKGQCEASNSRSPNPVGRGHVTSAILAAQRLGEKLPLTWRNRGQACFVGIGGVHRAVYTGLGQAWPEITACACANHATCATPRDTYHRHEVDCLANALATKSDCDPLVRGPFSDTKVTNALLIAGLLRALGASEVHVENVNMGHALVTDLGLLEYRTHEVR